MKIMFIIVPIMVFCVFIFVIALIASPKLRGKWMSRQIKATKYMIDDSKEDLTSMGTTIGNIGIKTKKNIIDANEENLTDMATKSANISKESIEITARAIKNGLTSDKLYCKHCGKSIDADSKFCKFCGKEE